MADDFARDVGISAGVGCATGFLWSVLAGQADVSTGEGLLHAVTGCVGSAAQSSSVYTATRLISKDPVLARELTAGWFGIQSAASFTNWLGVKHGLMDRAAFNAVALPLNYAAAPVSSTFGLVLAGIGEAANGFSGEVITFGGSLIFRHDLCFRTYYQTGAIGHRCSNFYWIHERLHETGHMVQMSIMGDAGMLTVNALNLGGQLLSFQGFHYRKLIIERWADKYADNTDKSPYVRQLFQLPPDISVFTAESGLVQVQLRKPMIIDGRAYSAQHPLFFGSNSQGEFLVVQGTLARDEVIGGVCYTEGTELEFNGLGEVASVISPSAVASEQATQTQDTKSAPPQPGCHPLAAGPASKQ